MGGNHRTTTKMCKGPPVWPSMRTSYHKRSRYTSNAWNSSSWILESGRALLGLAKVGHRSTPPRRRREICSTAWVVARFARAG
eukprot:scaffold17504_cov68-Phaeocystis_antarctica.AAC.1